MKSNQIRLLAVAPFFVTAMATSAIAQEAVMANSSSAIVTQVAASPAQADTTIFPMRVSIPAEGTYVFATPATNPVTLSLDGQVILTVPAAAQEGAEAFRVITTLAAGDHLIELAGVGISLEQVALVSMYELGTTPASIANSAEILTEEEATALAGSAIAPFGAIVPAGTQVASATPETFVIGGSSSTNTPVGSGTATVMTSGGSMAPTDGRSSGSDAVTTSSGTPTPTPTAAPTGSTRSSGATTVERVAPTPVTPTPGTPAPTPGTPAPTPGTPAPTPLPPAPPVIPPVIPAEMARASALTPPTGVALTQAIEITGGASEAGVVAMTGQTLFGQVMDPMTYDIVNAVIMPSGRETTVDVGPANGQFAVRLFPEDLLMGEATVTITGGSSADAAIASAPVAYEFASGVPSDGLTQALSRMTNGPTPDLYARIREIGFDNFVNEQLSPESINDAAFNAMNFDSMLRRDDNNFSNIVNRLFRHNLAHSAFSEKQLQDVMGDFWNNHFHSASKNQGNIIAQNIDDRDFFRENAFGSFADLLLYSARSPLMLDFLDNDDSQRTDDPNNRTARLNENYGREILELHTVGVDAGYTPEDVIAVSLVFTGWDYVHTNPDQVDVARTHEFDFVENRHDVDDKVIPFLNTTITGRSGAAGVQEGEELIAILADDPRTHSYVCGKIVQRLVADEAPASFVDLCTAAWVVSDGNAGEMVRAILTSPEFIANVELQRNKVKTPYEYAVSVIRALELTPDADDTNGNFFERFRDTARLAGYDPHRFLVPTGMDEVSSAWTGSAVSIAKFRAITTVIEREGQYNFNLTGQVNDAGLETAEEVAAYMLTIATADRFSLEEFENMVDVLKGADGIFEPLTDDETRAMARAAGLLVVLPSFQLQ